MVHRQENQSDAFVSNSPRGVYLLWLGIGCLWETSASLKCKKQSVKITFNSDSPRTNQIWVLFLGMFTNLVPIHGRRARFWLSNNVSGPFCEYLHQNSGTASTHGYKVVSTLYSSTKWYLGTSNTQCLITTPKNGTWVSEIPSVWTQHHLCWCPENSAPVASANKCIRELSCLYSLFFRQTQIHICFLQGKTSIEDKQAFTVKILLLFLYLFW